MYTSVEMGSIEIKQLSNHYFGVNGKDIWDELIKKMLVKIQLENPNIVVVVCILCLFLID